MRYLLLFGTLYGFWLLNSGHYNPLLLSLGGLSSALVVALLWRMDQIDREFRTLIRLPAVAAYGIWLLWQVIKSNMDVARRIWDPALPIDPVWRRLDMRLNSVLQTTLYANSITLTPGTLTVDVKDDYLIVHALSEQGVLDLLEGEMERRIRRLGI